MTELPGTVPMASAARPGARAIGLWAAAGLLALGVHVAVGYGMQAFSMANEMDGGPPPALAIELSPMLVAPAVQEDSAADVVTPEPPNQVEETVTELKPVVEPEPDQPEPVTEETEAVQPDETAPVETATADQQEQPLPLDEVVPDIVPAIAPDVVIPLPQAKPVEEKPVEKAKKTVEKPKPKPKKEKKEKTVQPKAVVTASVDAKPAAKASAPKASQSAARSGDTNRWNSSLAAWIRRNTRYPAAARSRRAEGTPNVTFTVDPSGRVLSVQLARSSGDADLDRAALSALRGKSVPAPPTGSGRLTRTAPFVFALN